MSRFMLTLFSVFGLLLATVGCSYHWSRSVELAPLAFEPGEEAVLLDIEAELVSESGEMLPCEYMRAFLVATWSGPPAVFTLSHGGAGVYTAETYNGQLRPVNDLEIVPMSDGSCLIEELLIASMDADAGGTLTLTVTIENEGSGPYGVPDEEASLLGSVSVVTE